MAEICIGLLPLICLFSTQALSIGQQMGSCHKHICPEDGMANFQNQQNKNPIASLNIFFLIKIWNLKKLLQRMDLKL